MFWNPACRHPLRPKSQRIGAGGCPCGSMLAVTHPVDRSPPLPSGIGAGASPSDTRRAGRPEGAEALPAPTAGLSLHALAKRKDLMPQLPSQRDSCSAPSVVELGAENGTLYGSYNSRQTLREGRT